MAKSPVRFPEEAVRTIEGLLEESAVEGRGAQDQIDGESTTHDEQSEIAVLSVGTDATAQVLRRGPFESGRFGVTTVGTAADAVERHAREAFDCLVSSYDLPDADGVELLRTIRAVDPEIPFVLLSGAGSEAVASEAISAGVTDYLRDERSAEEDPGSERLTERLADTISKHVRTYRTQRRRHDTAVSAPDDAVGLAHLRELFAFSMDAYGLYLWDWDLTTDTVERFPETEQVFGLPRSDLEPVFDTFIERVHPDHRERVTTALETAIADASSYHVQYSLDRGDDAYVWIEERGTVLTDASGEPIHVVGLNTVIADTNRRERELEWERKLNRTLHEALVESETRTELEATIVRQLHEYGYELVWIGGSLAGEIQREAVAGAEEYLDTLAPFSLETESSGGDIEPAVRAVQSGQSQYVDDISARADSAWRTVATQYGLGTEAAIPLVYNSVCYGVLAVYDEEPGSFDDTERRLLSELADTLAFVVHNIESKNALAADRQIHATIQLAGADYYLRELIEQGDCDTRKTRLIVHETLRQNDERYIQYVSVNGASEDAIVAAAKAHPLVDAVTVIGTETNPRIQITHRAETPEVLLTTVGARVRSTSVTARRADVLVVVANNSVLKMAIDALDAATESVSLLSSIERDRAAADSDGPLDELTERQATVLRAAYHRGYFERPRESSAKEVAHSLDISHPTLLEHLRLAQEKVFRHHFE